MPALGVGIVGARFAADLHAVNYRPLVPARVRLAAVCSRTRADVEKFAKHHDIPRAFTDVRQLVECPEVEVVDVCSTTDSHHEIAIAAARAGKHVIVEKPLTGFFGPADVDRQRMLDTALRNSDAVLEAVAKAGVVLCYAEDFVYAPPVAKLRRLLDASGGTIMELRAEESHSGSHSAYARRWQTAGGGALLRMGSHPVLITFEDGTKATVHSNDVTLGGVRNTVTAYLTNAVINANITPNTTMTAYAPDPSVWGDEYISEKVETKGGWQFPAPEEDWIRGYPQELEDFVAAITTRREPLSGGALARETVEVIYAGYLSAATGRRVDLARA